MEQKHTKDDAEIGNAMIKLMRCVGKPDWFQGVQGRQENGKNIIYLYVNTLLHATYIKAEIPMDVDAIPIKIICKSPQSRFYGRDGSSIYS